MQSSVHMLQKNTKLHVTAMTKCSEEESKSKRNRQYEHEAGRRLFSLQ